MLRFFTKAMLMWLCAELCSAVLNKGSEYTNRWVAQIEGGEEVAKSVAKSLDYTYKGQLGPFKDYYELVREDHPPGSVRHSDHLTRSLLDLDEVKWAKQQRVFKTVFKEVVQNKNDFGVNEKVEDEEAQDGESNKKDEEVKEFVKSEIAKVSNDPRVINSKSIFSSMNFPKWIIKFFKRLRQKDISKLGTFSTEPAPHSQLSQYKGQTKNIGLLSRKLSAYELYFTDRLWTKQWYMQDYRTDDVPVMDHNVVPVYKMGYSGKGVTVGVVDSAIQVDHPDLKENIDVDKSYDLCLNKPLREIISTYKPTLAHGTECAGMIAMVANNGKCGVGVAFDAKIAAINKYCPDKKETQEDSAKSVIQNLDMIDIYSFSWGPDDDAETVCLLGELNEEAFLKGVTKGRGGKGVIYVQSAGNGGFRGDNCATDCQLNHSFGIAITSANQYGKRSDFSEMCTAIFATTYSGNLKRYKGRYLERDISIIPGGKCTKKFHGTSASCPIAVGIIALTLEANPELTYRDVMHIIARSSEVAPLADNNSWYRNGNGFWVSGEFGFGLMNAENMVDIAKEWKTVPEKHICVFNIKLDNPQLLSHAQKASIPFETQGCSTSPSDTVVYMEHLEVIPLVKYPCRGDIQVTITSPAGTKSVLLYLREPDVDKDGLEGWPIMSVHNWGEDPRGKWILDFQIRPKKPRIKKAEGFVKEFTVKIHGIAEIPSSLEVQRKYAAFRLPNGVDELGNTN